MENLDQHNFVYGYRYSNLPQNTREPTNEKEKPNFNRYSQGTKHVDFSNKYDGVIIKIGAITAIGTLAVIISLVI
jgi:hypothetical protein